MFSLSIIIVTKNNTEELVSTLRSITELMNYESQLIIVNGSENDIHKNDLNIDKKWNCIILNGPDLGIYNGMNRGAQVATGEYLWFLNSGDVLSESNLIKCITKVATVVKPDILVGLQYPLLRFSRLTFLFSFKLLKIGARPISHQSSLISNDFFKYLQGYDEQFLIHSDQDFFLRSIDNNANIHKVNEVLTRRSLGGVGDQQKFGTFFTQIRDLRSIHQISLSKLDKMLIRILDLYIRLRQKYEQR